MNIEYMKNLIYTFVGSMALVLLTGCSAEFENGTPEPWQREINPNENYDSVSPLSETETTRWRP